MVVPPSGESRNRVCNSEVELLDMQFDIHELLTKIQKQDRELASELGEQHKLWKQKWAICSIMAEEFEKMLAGLEELMKVRDQKLALEREVMKTLERNTLLIRKTYKK